MKKSFAWLYGIYFENDYSTLSETSSEPSSVYVYADYLQNWRTRYLVVVIDQYSNSRLLNVLKTDHRTDRVTCLRRTLMLHSLNKQKKTNYYNCFLAKKKEFLKACSAPICVLRLYTSLYAQIISLL